MLLDERFRAGFARLQPHGLSFDGYLCAPPATRNFPTLPEPFPETTMILDHVGAPVGVGVYTGRRDEVFALWKKNMRELATGGECQC